MSLWKKKKLRDIKLTSLYLLEKQIVVTSLIHPILIFGKDQNTSNISEKIPKFWECKVLPPDTPNFSKPSTMVKPNHQWVLCGESEDAFAVLFCGWDKLHKIWTNFFFFTILGNFLIVELHKIWGRQRCFGGDLRQTKYWHQVLCWRLSSCTDKGALAKRIIIITTPARTANL